MIGFVEWHLEKDGIFPDKTCSKLLIMLTSELSLFET